MRQLVSTGHFDDMPADMQLSFTLFFLLENVADDRDNIAFVLEIHSYSNQSDAYGAVSVVYSMRLLSN